MGLQPPAQLSPAELRRINAGLSSYFNAGAPALPKIETRTISLPSGPARVRIYNYEDFFAAGRRFARGLPALLPLLGFFGTVIGQSITTFDLEKGFAGGLTTERLAGAIAGLGLKFETTLLGLVGNFVAPALLNLLERS